MKPFLHATLIVTACALAACGGGEGAGGGGERRNVLLVTLDTTRADFLSCYGRAEPLSPAIDAIAAEGVLFERALSTSAVTPVSHASILTGLDPPNHGLRVISALSGYRLPDGVPTLATLLEDLGWRTGAVHSAFPVSAYFGLERGFEHFESFDAVFEERGNRLSWDVGTFQRRSDETTDLAIDFVEQADGPFLLWVHYWDPHDPLRLPPDAVRAPMPAEPRARRAAVRERYAGEVRYMDSQLGRLIQVLKDRGLYDDTVVAITSDHGEGLGDHGWGGHRLLYEEQIRVPLIVRVPGGPRGRRVAQLVRTTDVLPTLLDWLGVPRPAALDGSSLRALMEGKSDEPRIAYADQINGYDLNAGMVAQRPLDDFLYCVSDGRWKLTYRPNHPERSELFDLATDPRELTNLYGRALDARRRLERELARRAGWVVAPFADDGTDAERAATARAVLERLGYVGVGDEGAPPKDDRWAWVCAEHRDALLAQHGACARCSEPLLLVRRP